MTAYWRFYAVLLLIVIVASGFTLFERYGTKAQEQRAQQRLTRSFSRQVADVRHPYGGVLGLLTVPRLGLRNVAVVDGASRAALQQGPAHDTASQYPGQQGVVVIVGHHRSYGAPFGQLARLRIGDLVTLQTIAGPLSYRVSRDPQVLSSRLGAPLVLPSPPEVQANGGNPLHAGEALVLATSQGTGSSPLLVVVATLDHTTADAPRSSPTAKVSGILRAVPGDRIGLLWATIWVLVLVGCFRFTRLWRKKLPALAVYPVATCVAVLVTYQLYLALDRVIPGTS
jgi:sortase A